MDNLYSNSKKRELVLYLLEKERNSCQDNRQRWNLQLSCISDEDDQQDVYFDNFGLSKKECEDAIRDYDKKIVLIDSIINEIKVMEEAYKLIINRLGKSQKLPSL